MTLVSVHHTLFNFRLFRLHCRPFICHPLSSLAIVVRPPPCCCIIRRLLASRRRLPAPSAATLLRTLSLRLPPPPAIFSRSSRRPLPALATANHRCRPTAPILELLCPPPALLHVVARLLSAPIVVVGAREGRGGGCRRRAPGSKDQIDESVNAVRRQYNDGMPSSDLRRGGAALAVVLAPCPDVVFVVVDAAMIVIVPLHHPQRGGSNDRCVGSCCWRRTIYPPPCPRRRSSGRTGSIRCHRARSHRHQC